MPKILLVEDDSLIAESVVGFLQAALYTVEHVESGEEALDRLKLYSYDVVILDWGLPGVSGTEVCQRYRAAGGQLPIIFLTAKSSLSDKIQGLDCGADDYLSKPFALGELGARLRALLRRPAEAVPDLLKHKDVTVDLKAGRATRQDRDLQLLPKELVLLEFMLRHRNQIFSAKDLLDRLWSSESGSTEEAVKQTILRLRKKIDTEEGPSLIVNVKGLGYRVDD